MPALQATLDVDPAQAVELLTRAQDFETRLHTLPADLDPTWQPLLAPEWSILDHLAQGHTRRRLTAQLLAAHCGGWPALHRWLDPMARLALLERHALLRQLCALALARRPGVLRCCLERQARQALKQALGPCFAPLLALSDQGRAVSAVAVDWSPIHWACVGYGDWIRTLQEDDRVLRRIVRLSLPRGLLNMPQLRSRARAELPVPRALAGLAEQGMDWPC